MDEQQIIAELLAMTQADNRNQGDENRSPFLESNRTRTKELGQHLWDIGRLLSMQRALSQMPKYDRRELDCAWDNVGDWRC